MITPEQFLEPVLKWCGASGFGGAMVALALYVLHKSKSIPFKIVWGNQSNGKSHVTYEECSKNHEPINSSINKISEKQDMLYDRQSTVLEEIAFIKGAISRDEARKRNPGR